MVSSNLRRSCLRATSSARISCEIAALTAARQIGHSGGARARSRNGAAVCGPAFNDAPSYRAAEAPIGRKVQREVLSTMVPDEIERGDAVVIAGDSFAID